MGKPPTSFSSGKAAPTHASGWRRLSCRRHSPASSPSPSAWAVIPEPRILWRPRVQSFDAVGFLAIENVRQVEALLAKTLRP